MPERDEHYIKYRVFHEPSDDVLDDPEGIGHPVPVEAYYPSSIGKLGEWDEQPLEEVDGLFFVLRPENDEFARVAMAAYAYACRREFPHLAADIIMMIEGLEWEEQTGQHRDDIPVDSDDYLDPSGEHLSDNVVTILRERIKPNGETRVEVQKSSSSDGGYSE